MLQFFPLFPPVYAFVLSETKVCWTFQNTVFKKKKHLLFYNSVNLTISTIPLTLWVHDFNICFTRGSVVGAFVKIQPIYEWVPQRWWRMTLQHPKSSISNPSFLYLSSVSKNVAFVSGPRYWNRENICRAIQKCVIRHMWTVKAQIRLRIRAVWSGPSLSTNTIIGYYKMYELRAENQMILWTCAEWSETVYFVYVWRHFFCLTWAIY